MLCRCRPGLDGGGEWREGLVTGGVDRNPPGPWGGWEAVLGAWPGPLKRSGATLSRATPSVHSTAFSLQLDSGFTQALARCLTIFLHPHLDRGSRK